MSEIKKPKIIMVVIYTLIILLSIFAGLKSSDTSMLTNENSFYIDKESFNPSFNVRKIKKEEQGKQEYKINIKGESLSHLKTDSLIFFMNKITDNAYSVRFNDIIIGEEGDMLEGNSMIKNSAHHFTFDRKLIKDENELVIRTHGNYKSGSEADGIYIVEKDIGMDLAQQAEYLSNNILVSGIVFLMFSAFLMVLIYFFNENKEYGFLYCALALLFISIYFIDYLKIIHLENTYLTYKKIFLTSLHIGIWFTLMAMRKFLNIKQIKYLPGVSAIGFLLMSLFVDNFVSYKRIYSLWYILLIVILVLASIYSLKNLKKSRYAFIFVITFFYLALYGGGVLAIERFTSSLRLNSPIVYITIFAAIPILFAFEELTSKETQILTDGLTGLWNQRFIYNKLEEKIKDSVVVLIDIDDFKDINDNYSHLAGDFIIKEFARFAKDSVRKNDDVCRYGGDEFVIILYDCPLSQAAKKMELLRKKVKTIVLSMKMKL